jgi:hypothetical protein
MRLSKYIFLFLMLAVVISDVPTRSAAGNNEVTICPVHQVVLKKETLKIAYGLVPGEPCDLNRAKAAAQLFPYANSVVHGGCVTDSNSPKTVEVLYCPKCRAAEKAWRCLTTSDTLIITTLPPPRITRLPTVH